MPGFEPENREATCPHGSVCVEVGAAETETEKVELPGRMRASHINLLWGILKTSEVTGVCRAGNQHFREFRASSMFMRDDRTIQRHLRVLVENGLVVVTLRGPKREMAITPEGLWLLQESEFLTIEQVEAMTPVRVRALYALEESKAREAEQIRNKLKYRAGGWNLHQLQMRRLQEGSQGGPEPSGRSQTVEVQPTAKVGEWKIGYGGTMTLEDALRGSLIRGESGRKDLPRTSMRSDLPLDGRGEGKADPKKQDDSRERDASWLRDLR